jgi:hypothetical protein
MLSDPWAYSQRVEASRMPDVESHDEEGPIKKESITIGSFTGPLVNVTKIHQNLSQEVIMITEDKAQLILSKHLKNMEMRRDWVAPLGILIAIVTAFSTSTFKDAGLDASTWRAIFVIVGALSSLWLFKSAMRSRKAPKVEDVVDQMKKSNE